MNRQIEYQCNECKKIRMLLISNVVELKSIIEETGTVEFVDVHPCTDNEMKASLLHVDSYNKVRSQWIIEAEENGDGIRNRNDLIPMTPKIDLPNVQIIPTSDYGAFNLKGFKIKDKLRQCFYTLNENVEGEKIFVKSPLNFVEFEAIIAKEINIEIAKKWIEKTAKLIESLPVLEEIVITFIPSYLDNFITFEPKERELQELELLFHSPISSVYTTDEKIKLFSENWKSICPDIGMMGFKKYLSLLKGCNDEYEKTLMDVYFQVGAEYTYPYFIASMSELLSIGLVHIEKLEFITIKE